MSWKAGLGWMQFWNFFLNQPLGEGPIILMMIQKTQVAGSGNKGIVTSVFNCQLTTGLLFINMVGSRISTTWLWTPFRADNSFERIWNNPTAYSNIYFSLYTGWSRCWVEAFQLYPRFFTGLCVILVYSYKWKLILNISLLGSCCNRLSLFASHSPPACKVESAHRAKNWKNKGRETLRGWRVCSTSWEVAMIWRRKRWWRIWLKNGTMSLKQGDETSWKRGEKLRFFLVDSQKSCGQKIGGSSRGEPHGKYCGRKKCSNKEGF